MILQSIILPALIVGLLAAGWGGVQLLARRMGTKNHIENDSCGSCSCSGICDREKDKN